MSSEGRALLVESVGVGESGLPYWELDCGGPARRAHGLPAIPDFAFPQQQSQP